MSNTTRYFPEFRIYKPTQSNSGAASALQIKLAEVDGRWELQLFWTATQQIPSQTENASFAWKNKEKTVIIKLGDPDVGEILAVIYGIKDSVGRKDAKDKPGKGLFHKNATGNTTMSLQEQTDEKSGEISYRVRLASKKGDKLIQVSHTITIGEAIIIRKLLEQWIVSSYGWDGLFAVGEKVGEVPVDTEGKF